MTRVDESSVRAGTARDVRGRLLVTLVAVTAAVVVNVVLFWVGRAAGGYFGFTRSGSRVHVNTATVAGFSALPLGVGLAVVALLAGRLPWVSTVAAVVAPVLAVATIGLMTLPVDLDATSTVTLAACHLSLVPISLGAIRGMRDRPGLRWPSSRGSAG